MPLNRLVPKRSIQELIQTQAKIYGDKPFLIYPDDHREISYIALEHWTFQVARLLRRLKVEVKDFGSILMQNSPEFVFCYLGLMRAGCVAAPINVHLAAPEIAYILNHSESKVLFTTPEFLSRIESIRHELKFLRHMVVLDAPKESSYIDFYKSLASISGSTLGGLWVESIDDAEIIYTSGTTGKPKGVLLTHENILVDAQNITEWFHFNPENRLMCILPLFHVNGEIVTLMTPLYFGGSVVLNERFSASNFWQRLAEYKVNCFSTVPSVLSILLNNPKPEGLDLGALRFAICGAAPLPVELMLQFEKTFGIPIVEGYGLSETTCYSSFNPLGKDRRVGSIGVAVGNEMTILDEWDEEVPPGEIGEICVRGENVLQGYFKNPEATKQAFRRGGWFATGDLGMKDSDGFFYIMDRKKEMINRGGEKVFPREVDEVLFMNSKVKEAATVGIADKIYGEEVRAYVVLKDGSYATDEEIIQFCKQHLAWFKCPKSIRFVKEIPKGPTGKILRRELSEQKKLAA